MKWCTHFGPVAYFWQLCQREPALPSDYDDQPFYCVNARIPGPFMLCDMTGGGPICEREMCDS